MTFDYNTEQSNNIFAGLFQGREGKEVTNSNTLANIEKCNDLIREGKYGSDDWKKSLAELPEEFQKLYTDADHAALAIQNIGGKTYVGATGIEKMKLSMEDFATTAKAAAIQFAAFFIITEGLALLIKGLQKTWDMVPTENHVKQWAEDANSELDKTNSELEELNQELTTTQDRIDELQSKGTLTLTEQRELERLRLQNLELERQLKLKEALKKEQSEDATKKNLDAAKFAYEELNSAFENYVDLKAEYDSSLHEPVKIPGKELSDKEYYQMYGTYKRKEEPGVSKERVEHYKDSLADLIAELQPYLSAIDPSYLVGEQLDQYNAMMELYNRTLLESGTMSLDDFIRASLGSVDYDSYIDKLHELAEAGTITPESVEVAFQKSMPEVLDLLNELGFTAADLANEVASFRDIGDVVSNIISGNSNFSDIQNTIDEITSSDFEITTESIASALGEEFVSAMDKAGVSVSDLCNWLKILQQEAGKISIKDATGDLKSIEEDLNALSDAYYEFVDDSGKVSSETLDGLTETFSAISDTNEFEKFINVLGDSSSTMDELKSATDDLVDRYFLQKAALGELTEEHKALYIAQLKQMGVSNASEVVEQKLAIATIKAMSAKEELTAAEQAQLEAAQKVITELDNEDSALMTLANSCLTAAQQEDLLKARQDAIAGSNFANVIANHASVLAIVAEAAGLSAEGVMEYAAALEIVGKVEKQIANGGYVHGSAADAYADAKEVIANRQNMIDSLQEILIGGGTTADFAPVRTKDKSGKTAAEEAYEKGKKKLDNQLERNKISYKKYYKELVKLGNEHFKGDAENMREHYATLADVRRDAYAKYQGDLDKDLDSGIITLEEYHKKAKALSKEWLDGRKSNEKDYLEAVEAIYDKINDMWGTRISDMEEQMNRWTLDQTWAPGVEEVDIWESELAALDKHYKDGLFDSEKEYFDLRYQLQEKLRDANKESYEAELDLLEEQKDSIQELIDLTSDMLKQQKEDEIEALEKQVDLYSEIVDKKKESLDLTREEDSYRRELEEQNAALAELQAKAAVLALDDSRAGKAAYQEILNQIKEQQQTIADSQAEHTYDGTISALDDAEAAYQKSIDKQIEEINDLLNHAGKWLEYVYDYIRTTNPSKLFEELRDYNYEHGDGMDVTVTSIKESTAALLEKFNSSIPDILAAIKKQKEATESKLNDAGEGKDSTPSGNYKDKISSALNKKIQASATEDNKHATNRGLVTKLKEETGLDSWYDEKNKVIYVGSEGDRRVTAGAYNVIQKMREVNESSLSVKEKENKLNDLLDTLKRKWSYEYSYLEEKNGKFHLYKKSKKKSTPIQVFHSGYARGYVGENAPSYTPDAKQRELLALLEAGELVVNKTQQGYLLSQLQTLQTLSDGLRKLQLDSVPGDTYGVGEINIEVNAPITITGSADADTIKELEKFKKNLSNDVLGEVTSAMKRKGYGGNTAVNARKK